MKYFITICLLISLTCVGQSVTSNQPLYVIQTEDGSRKYEIKVNDEYSLSKIDPSWISSIEVLKGDDAAARFAESGTHGAVIITIGNEYLERIPADIVSVFEAESQTGILFVLQNENGKQFLLKQDVGPTIDNLQADWVREVSVLKHDAAKDKFGDAGSKGVVILTISSKHIDKLPAEIRKELTE